MNAERFRRFGPDLGLAAASLVAALSLSRLLGGGLGGPSTGPLLAASAVGSALAAVLAHRRVHGPLRMAITTIGVALVSLWTTSPSSTTVGIPTRRTWHVLQSNLHIAHPVLAAFSLPLRSTEGVVLLAALLAGTTSALASVLLHATARPGYRRPGLALLGPFGLLAFSCAKSPSSSVALPIVLFVVASAVTFSLAQPASIGPPVLGGGLTRIRNSPVITLGLAIVVAVTLTAVTLGTGGNGAAGSAGGTGRVPPTGLSLTSRLVALEVNDANVKLFVAHSPYPTYWQVAVLNVLRNGVWVVGSKAATTPPSIVGERAFTATVEVGHLSTRLLPVPPATISVSGKGIATFTEEGVHVTDRTTGGQQYSTTSGLPVLAAAALAGSDPVSSYPAALVQSEVALPPLPPDIVQLARDATAGASTPLGQAEALTNWFRSGRFRYTLDPPHPAPGADPLVAFLTQTRAGTCEQFAGAFTVLARSLGLPTRLVVGFTAGKRTGAQEVTVTGGDAHAWPQVYLGPAAGWVSFEPTPQQLTGQVAPDGIIGATSPPSTGPTTTPTTNVTQPTTTPTTAPPTIPPTTPVTAVPRDHYPTTVHPKSPVHHFPWWVLAPVLGLPLAVVMLIALRRRRRWSTVGRTPIAASLRAAAELDRAFARAGVPRPRWQPQATFISQLADQVEVGHHESYDTVGVGDQLLSLLHDAATVAAIADRALFDLRPLDAISATDACDASRRVAHGLQDREIRRYISSQLTVRPAASAGTHVGAG